MLAALSLFLCLDSLMELNMLFAFIDPNAGSLLWQILAAGAVGSMLYFRTLLWHLVSLRFLWKRDDHGPE